MNICQKCEKEFPTKVKIDGKFHNLQNRKYCLECSPFGIHNTKKLNGQPRKQIPFKFLCEICGETNPKNFYIKNNRPYKICKHCHNKKTHNRQKENKKKAVEYKGGKCQICGYDKCYRSLDFHHIDPTRKDFTISHIDCRSFENIKHELDKCIIVCKNCHGEIHEGLINIMDLSPGLSREGDRG
jgi:hypothetical protein